jgi:NADH-quinone oxidoreductase subunit L
MTMPLIVLAFFSVVVAWGWPLHDAEASVLHHAIFHSQYSSVGADFGVLPEDPESSGPMVARPDLMPVRYLAAEHHHLAGNLALLVGMLGIGFALLLYYYRVLDPAEAKEQFPALHRFLWNKWYFDELYSVLLVRPALTAAGWCRAFDTKAIDGTVNSLANVTLEVSRWSGKFDLRIIDGLVNLTARVIYGIGGRLRGVQTGFLRSYVLFLVLAAIAIFGLMCFVVARVMAG